MRIVIAVALALAASGCKDRKPSPSEEMIEIARSCAQHAEMSCPRPILHVRNLRASQTYYRDALGFKVDWDHGDPADFGAVSRSETVLFMCEQCQGNPGSWTMIFARDVDGLHEELVRRKAIIKMPPTNMPWGLREMQVADPDGNVLRFGSSIDH